MLFLFFLSNFHISNAQYVWEKDYPGHFSSAIFNDLKNYRGKEVMAMVNSFSIISRPKGFSVNESYHARMKDHHAVGDIMFSFPIWFTYDHSAPQLQKDDIYGFTFIFNDRSFLRDQHSILFPEETNALGLPEMFTDTFQVQEREMNHYILGYTLNRFANRNNRMYVLNPRRRACFRAVTREEYLRLWIGKLGLDINKETEQLSRDREELKPLLDKPEFQSIRQVSENALKMREGYITFLKERKLYYQHLLAGLTPEQEKSPAFYTLPKDPPIITNANGSYSVRMNGHLNYEPDEGAPAIATGPVLTYSDDFFDTSLPPTVLQLIVIYDGFTEEAKDPLKDFFDEKFYAQFDYRKLADLMYR